MNLFHLTAQDEIFHVSQAQAYCLGDWQAWDPALTTPPGLYLIPVGVSRLLELLGFQRRCIDLAFLRNTNVILLTLLPTLVRSIAWNLHSEPATARANDAAKQSSAQNGSSPYWLVVPALSEEYQWALSVRAYAIVSLPILWFFGFLFYTDVGSLFAVLMCYWLAQRGWLYPSALVRAPLRSQLKQIADSSASLTGWTLLAALPSNEHHLGRLHHVHHATARVEPSEFPRRQVCVGNDNW